MDMNSEDSSYWYIASYPKSGNTWVRLFISDLLKSLTLGDKSKHVDLNNFNTGTIASNRQFIDQYIGIESSDLTIKELDKIRYKINLSNNLYVQNSNFFKVHDSFENPSNPEKPLICTRGCMGAIYIIRNPFDVSISLANHFSCTYDKAIKFLINNSSSLCGSLKSCKTQVRQYLGSWDYHVMTWNKQQIIPLLVLRYEDLINEPIKEFTKLAMFLNLTKDQDLIENSIENCKFEKLQFLENKTESGFEERPSNCKTFFKYGCFGTGKKKLSNVQRSLIKDKFISTLNEFDYLNFI